MDYLFSIIFEFGALIVVGALLVLLSNFVVYLNKKTNPHLKSTKKDHDEEDSITDWLEPR